MNGGWMPLIVTALVVAGSIQSRDTLLSEVWGYQANLDTRTVDTHVRRLREKLGRAGRLVETVRGSGYRLNTTES